MPPVSSEQPPDVPARDDDPLRPPPRPVAPPGQVSTPDQLPTVEPGEWPAQPLRPMVAATPPQGPPAPPLPTSPPPAGPVAPAQRSLAWLWTGVAAALALVVGAAATLAVLRPWDDDTESDLTAEASVSAPRSDIEPAPQTTPTPTPADPVEPVTADIDGDGYGDAAAVFGSGDEVQRFVLSGTGTSFKVAREREAAFEDRTWADFDSDGALDEVSWSYELGGGLILTSADMDFEELNLRLRLDERQPFVTLKPGDFDGDGAVDLVAYGATGPRTVSVWVMHNDDGRFDEPEEWMRIPRSTYALTTVLPADFTGDGATDLAVRVPTELPRKIGPDTSIELGVSLLVSAGATFVPGPVARPTGFLDRAEAVVGDFTGDGMPRVLLIGTGRDGVRIEGLRRDGDRFILDPGLALAVGGKGARVVDAVVSDVDGDRVDDIVYTTSVDRGRAYDGFRVLRLDVAGVESSEVWARTPRCPKGDCSFYFENSF